MRNLIGIISMSATSISRGLPVGEALEKHRKHADAINRSVVRMDRLIKDLLNVGIIEAGQLKLALREEDVQVVLSQALEDLQPLAVARSVELRVEMPPRPTAVHCDRQRVFQVLSNIVGNAIKFTPEGGSIVVSSESHEDAVLFTVRDTGPGIDAEHLSRIFERYYQAGAPESRGVGLGLFIAKGIVEAHGGRIWVESIAGEGAASSSRSHSCAISGSSRAFLSVARRSRRRIQIPLGAARRVERMRSGSRSPCHSRFRRSSDSTVRAHSCADD